jgi:signal transduction histidine kinase
MPSQQPEVQAVQALSAVPTILEAVASITGLRFVCVAHVTADSWTACAILDKLEFGLQPGDHLDVATTLCEEVRDTGAAVVIDSVRDSQRYCNHHTPRMYGFQSYFSIPVYHQNGMYFGTLCGLDPEARNLSGAGITASLTLFAQLISLQLANEGDLEHVRSALSGERETAELREQFIAVLGHDLRNPLGAIVTGMELLEMQNMNPRSDPVFERLRRSVRRITGLVDDLVDFARGRMGGGIPLALRAGCALDAVFEQVIDELRAQYPQRRIVAEIATGLRADCDPVRMAQLLSNLLKNALVHGAADAPVLVRAGVHDDQVELAVTSAGPALPKDVRAQLFKPYWRASDTARDGLGLGLFIVSEIARSHGGTITVESQDNANRFVYRAPQAEKIL